MSIEDWDVEFRLMADRRAEKSPHYGIYRDFLGLYLPPNDQNVVGFSLSGLSVAQKWLLMLMTDIFFDSNILNYNSYDDWLDHWSTARDWFLPGYALLLESPDVLDRSMLDKAWNNFRGAIS